MVSPVPKHCWKWLESSWMAETDGLQCRRCRSAISDAKHAEFGSPWFAQIDQIKEQAEVAAVSVA